MRDFIAGVLLLAFIFVFCASLIAFLKPLPKLKLPSRKSGLKGLGIALILLIAAIIAIPKPEEGKLDKGGEVSPLAEGKSASTEKSQALPAKLEPALSVSLTDFSDVFNIIARTMDKPWKANFRTGEGGAFRFTATENLVITGTARDDGKIISILAVAGGDGTSSSGLDVFVFFTSIYCAVHQFEDPKQCGTPVMNMINKFEQGGKPSATTLNNIKFEYLRDEVVGNWLTVAVS